MHTSFTFKNLDPSESLKSYATDKLSRFDKYLDNPAEASVVLTVEKFRHIAEINLVGDRLSINGREETGDMYSAIDKVLDKLGKQIKKSKQKVRKRRATGKARARQRDAEASATLGAMEEPDEDSFENLIVESMEYKPMDLEEAVLQLDLAEEDFLVFTNARTGMVNVLHRGGRGDLRLIEPSN